ncbi:DUF2493 domain-containing protein [Egibacter rhizosphaerae]|uniref:DUF2493 domain-containing protein n=1 Tax=Egibacter rhizosphaerae TaxID=1670831 RepID=A0A411YDT7_9ACTN|nr:SLOG family protein [Egibacter rhizosphaerae]QBI19368.1 DUF2493 domain-containing protein [Egibacter rhizosphaerae]
MRVLVCGSRDWDDEQAVHAALYGWYAIANGRGDTFTVIEGGAPGADRCALTWPALIPRGPGIRHQQYPADWDTHGNAAGPIRNERMLRGGRPDLVLAFHEDPELGRGTADMVERARKAEVPVYVIGRG